MILLSVDPDQLPLDGDELNVLAKMVTKQGQPLQSQTIIELGCGNARLSCDLVQRYAQCTVTGLEVDAVQHAKNLARAPAGVTFVAAGAQDVPFADASFDLALMLKSLHHVSLDLLDRALSEVARVLRPAAQAALDRAIAKGEHWQQVAEYRFAQAVHYANFDEFAKRMLYPTFADHGIDEATTARVKAAFEPHCTSVGASFVRPMHVRLLRRIT